MRRPFRTALRRTDFTALAYGLGRAEHLFELARSTEQRRERCVYETQAICVLRETYRNAGLVPGGEA